MPRQSAAKSNVEINTTPSLIDKLDIRATAKCDETIRAGYQERQSAALIAVAGLGKFTFVARHAGNHHPMHSEIRELYWSAAMLNGTMIVVSVKRPRHSDFVIAITSHGIEPV